MANQGKRMVSEKLINILKEMDEKNISIGDLAEVLEAFADGEVQPKLTAGDNITITDENVISAIDTTYTAGTGITITDEGVISASGGSSIYHHKVMLNCSTGCITTAGYESFVIDIILEMFTNSATTPSLSSVFSNVKKEFMNGIVYKSDLSKCYEIVDGRFLSFDLANNGSLYVLVNDTPTLLNLSNSIQSSANSSVISMGYDTLIP